MINTRLNPAHAHHPGPLIDGCVVCQNKTHIQTCKDCKLVAYCGKAHQAADWANHKDFCNRVSDCYEAVQNEEQALRAKSAVSDGFLLPRNIFETHAGHFWGLPDTRSYMRALSDLAAAQTDMKTTKAIQKGLETCLEMHRLCRSDNLGIRNITPVQHLRLGKDQECYDFLKWYAMTGGDPSYDWGDLNRPYLNIKDADVFESIGPFVRGRFSELALLVPLFLLKLRLVFDLKYIWGSTILSGETILQAFRELYGNLLGNALQAHQDTLGGDMARILARLERQLKKLYKKINSANKYFWPALRDPTRRLNVYTEYFSPGKETEVQVVLRDNYPAWIQTSGAILAIPTYARV